MLHKTIGLLAALSSMFVACAVFAAPLKIATLAVENMTCGTCPIVVKKALAHIPGVTATQVDMEKKTATVTFDPDKATSAQLAKAVTEAGFPSKIIATP